MSDINYKVKTAGELIESEISEYLSVLSEVYGREYTRHHFTKRYNDDKKLTSIVILAYYKNKIVGVQTFMRCDIDRTIAYQSGDSVVLSSQQGKGIFSSMVRLGVEIIGNELIFGFPNPNSLPAFKKMGWQVMDSRRYKVKFRIDEDNLIKPIKSKLLKCFIDKNVYYYWKQNNTFYLLQKKTKIFYLVIGIIQQEDTKYFKRIFFPILTMYKKNGHMGVGITIISLNNKCNINVPLYLMDTLL